MRAGNGAGEITLGGARLTADPSGALFWAAEATLMVADLHFEKGATFAARGALLPPYDTRATLDALERLLGIYAPRRVVALGDSFHEAGAEHRMGAADARRLADLVAAVEWIWVVGNHDPVAPERVGGRGCGELALGPLVLRHQAETPSRGLEISGHYHPKARLTGAQRGVSRRCFVADEGRLILPAFGAYAGGLDVREPAIAELFPRGFTAYLLGKKAVLPFPSARLLDPPA